MFFSHQLLILKKSSFSLIWRYMHDRNHKVSKRELQKIDVGQACEDLRSYVPTGKLEQAELQNKMSLYLLAQLTYGVVLVHNVQADFLIADLKRLHKSLARHPPEEPLAIEDDTNEKKKKTPRSKRKKPEDDEEELEDEEYSGRKRRRTTKGKKKKSKGPQLLDLTDARSYVDGLVPGQSKPPVDEFNELEDNFMDQSETTERLPPPEWPPLSEPLKASAYDLLSPEEANAHFLREVERALLAGREPVRASVEMGEDSQLDVTAEVQQEIDQQPMVESGSVYAPSEGIQLEPLPVEPRRGKKGRGKKRKGPIIDKETQIPLEVMMEHMMDIGPTIRTMADLRRERAEREYRAKVPHADVLFSTHSENIQNFVNNLDEDLRYMFDLRTYKPPTYEENCKRWAAAEKAFGSGPFGRLPSEPDLDQSELPGAEFMLGRDDGPKISVFDESLVEGRDGGQRISIFGESLVEGRDSVLSEVEEARQARLTLQRSLSGRTGEPSAHQPLVDLDVSHVSDSIPMADLSLADQDTLGAEDIQLQWESILVKPSPDRSEEQDWSSDTSKQLYSSILNKTQEQGRRSIYFHEAAEVDKLDLKQAARSFFSLLCLLKQGKVKARRQQQPFGKIEIRVRGHHDRTMEEEEEEGAGEHVHDGGGEMAEEI